MTQKTKTLPTNKPVVAVFGATGHKVLRHGIGQRLAADEHRDLARKFRKIHGGLPRGVRATVEDQIAATKNIEVRLNSSVIAVEGADRCETITVQNNQTRATEKVSASALLIYAGAVPHTDWLAGVVERDTQGYVISGQHLMLEGNPTRWTAARDPFYLETSVPGIFVAGDVRHRSAKGVTSGVGEGAMAVKLVHQYLGLL